MKFSLSPLWPGCRLFATMGNDTPAAEARAATMESLVPVTTHSYNITVAP